MALKSLQGAKHLSGYKDLYIVNKLMDICALIVDYFAQIVVFLSKQTLYCMATSDKLSRTVTMHNLIFLNYIRVLKKYGEVAKKMAKGALYEEAGAPFGYCEETAGKIIRAILRQPEADIRILLLKNEAEDMLDLVLQLKGV
jgi:hypothetical protein